MTTLKACFAARLWWALHYYGHENVAVLDGGWNKWIAEDRPTESRIPDYEPVEFIPRPNPNWIRSSDEVLNAVPNGLVKLLDFRTAMEYTGDCSRARHSGHIPGAINLPRRQLVTPDGRMPSPEVLHDIFGQYGINENTTIITYCNSGVSASYGLLALHVAGVRQGAVYDGSWKDWGNDDSKPVE
jgi:thiosulfate/3-mercaptopyruvate sulfurtransferase